MTSPSTFEESVNWHDLLLNPFHCSMFISAERISSIFEFKKVEVASLHI